MDDITLRKKMVNKLTSILSGAASRVKISEWAFDILDDDGMKTHNVFLKYYLSAIGSVDLLSTDRQYLYTDEDINAWIEEINTKYSFIFGHG